MNTHASLVTKPTNSSVQQIERLRNRAERDRHGLFYAEGVRALSRAIESGHEITSIVHVPHLLTHGHARNLIERARRRGVPVMSISIELFQRLSRVDDPQWVGFSARQRWTRLEDTDPRAGLCWVGVETIRSPGNLGTMVRTCRAAGAAGMIAIGPEADPYDPGSIRASMGAVFDLPLVRATRADLLNWATRTGVQLVATSPDAAHDFREVDYRAPVVVLMGGERKGLTDGLQSRCQLAVRIPMAGKVDSLNVAAATAVVLYEIQRQRSC